MSVAEIANLTAIMMSGKGSSAMEGKAAAIRRAAYLCFAKHGYHGTTVDLICGEAGISKGAFYWHYDSKLTVFLVILNTWADEVELELNKQFATALKSRAVDTEIAGALRREGHRVLAILPVWLEFIAQSSRNDEMRAAIAKFHDRIRTVIFNLLLPALTPAFNEDEVRVLASTILGAFIGLASQKLGDPETDFDAHIGQVLGIIIRHVFPES
jgi:AcrR family transcriptional regulator